MKNHRLVTSLSGARVEITRDEGGTSIRLPHERLAELVTPAELREMFSPRVLANLARAGFGAAQEALS